MARFTVLARDNTQHLVHCNQCGKSDLFQHSLRLLTCNGCGNTFSTQSDATVIAEQVVTQYHSNL